MQSEKKQKTQKQLESHTIALMGAVALVYEVLQITFSWLGLGLVIIPIYYMHFWLWFRMHDIEFFTLKRAGGLGIGGLIEIMTAGIAPALFVNVMVIALDNRVKGIIKG